MATTWAVVAMVQGSSGLVWLQGVSWLQLWTAVATSQGAETNKIGLSIVVAAWDSRCYGTRIEQAGSDIFHIKLKNQKKKFENTKNPALNPSFNSTRLSLASCPKSLGRVVAYAAFSFYHTSYLSSFLFSHCRPKSKTPTKKI